MTTYATQGILSRHTTGTKNENGARTTRFREWGQHTNTAVQKEMEFHSLSTGSQNKAGQNARSELVQQQQISME